MLAKENQTLIRTMNEMKQDGSGFPSTLDMNASTNHQHMDTEQLHVDLQLERSKNADLSLQVQSLRSLQDQSQQDQTLVTEFQALMDNHQRLSMELAAETEQSVALQRELEQVRIEFRGKEQLLQDRDQQLHEMDQQLLDRDQQLEVSMAQLAQQRQQEQQHVEELTKALDAARAELQEKVVAFVEEQVEQKDRVESLQQQVAILRQAKQSQLEQAATSEANSTEADTLRQQAEVYQQRIVSLESRATTAEESLTRLQATCESLQLEKETLAVELKQKSEDQKKTIDKQLAEAKKTMELQLVDTRNTIDKLRGDNAKSELAHSKALAAEEAKRKELERELDEKRSEIQALDIKVEKLKAAVEKSREELVDAMKEQAQIEQSILQTSLREKTQLLGKRESELADLKLHFSGDFASLQKKLEETTVERDSLRMELDSCKEQLKTVQNFVASSLELVNDLKLDQKEADGASISDENEVASLITSPLSTILANCSSNIGSLRQKVAELELVKSSLSEDLQARVKEVQRLSETNDGLKSELATTHEAAHRFEHALADSQRSYTDTVQERDGQIASLAKKLQHLELVEVEKKTLLTTTSAVESFVRILEDKPSFVDLNLVGFVDDKTTGRLAAALIKYQQDLQRVKEKNFELERRMEKLTDEREAMIAQYQNLVNGHEAETDLVGELDSRCATLSQKVKEQAEALADVTSQWKRACEAVNEKSKAIEDLETRLKESLEKNAITENHMNKVQVSVSTEKQTRRELEVEIMKAQDESKKLRETLEKDRESASSSLDMIESLLNDEKERNRRLSESIATLNKTINDLNTQENGVSTQLELVRALEQQKEDLYRQLDASKDIATKAEKELEALLDNCQLQDLELANARDAMDTVNKFLREVLGGLPDLDLTASEVFDMDQARLMDRFRVEINMLIRRQITGASGNRDVEDLIHDLKTRLADLTAENQRLVSQTNDLLKELEESSKQPIAVERQPVASTEDPIDSRTIEQYEKMISSMKQQLREADSKLLDLTREWTARQREYDLQQTNREVRIAQLEAAKIQSDALMAEVSYIQGEEAKSS